MITKLIKFIKKLFGFERITISEDEKVSEKWLQDNVYEMGKEGYKDDII